LELFTGECHRGPIFSKPISLPPRIVIYSKKKKKRLSCRSCGRVPHACAATPACGSPRRRAVSHPPLEIFPRQNSSPPSIWSSSPSWFDLHRPRSKARFTRPRPRPCRLIFSPAYLVPADHLSVQKEPGRVVVDATCCDVSLLP
jgi:hypothetical protein